MKTFHKFTLLFLFLSIFNATLSCSSNDKTLPQPIPDIPKIFRLYRTEEKPANTSPDLTLTNHTMANLLKESASSHIITVHGVIHPSLSLWNISSKEIRKSITLFIIPDQGMVILVRLKFTPLPIPIEKDIRFKELMTSK